MGGGGYYWENGGGGLSSPNTLVLIPQIVLDLSIRNARFGSEFLLYRSRDF